MSVKRLFNKGKLFNVELLNVPDKKVESNFKINYICLTEKSTENIYGLLLDEPLLMSEDNNTCSIEVFIKFGKYSKFKDFKFICSVILESGSAIAQVFPEHLSTHYSFSVACVKQKGTE